jgi:SAM-dependent methyltransferase
MIKKFIKKLFVRCGYTKEIWKDNLAAELSFWDYFIKTKGAGNNEDYKQRVNPNSEFQENLRSYLDKEAETNKILDVGAGPLTSLKKKCDFTKIKIVAVDPLADEYDSILQKYNIQPIVKTQKCEGEKLTEKFVENMFDIVYSGNALDHSYDPLKCIEEMIKVAKKEHYVIIQVFYREGKKNSWSGLHQWDFFIERRNLSGDQRLYLQGRGKEKIDIIDLYKCIMKQVYIKKDDKLITAVYRKI